MQICSVKYYFKVFLIFKKAIHNTLMETPWKYTMYGGSLFVFIKPKFNPDFNEII